MQLSFDRKLTVALLVLMPVVSLLTGNAFYRSVLVFGMINAGCESGMVVVNLVPFVLGCCLFKLALFREVGWDKAASRADSAAAAADGPPFFHQRWAGARCASLSHPTAL